MIKNRIKTIAIVAFLIIVTVLFIRWKRGDPESNIKTGIIKPIIGDVAIMVTTTGVVEPQNRLEIKPSIGGRIDEIIVKEGDHVKEGKIMAWMSSTERAALIDAARPQGDEVLRYWEDAYKKTPIISPIDGEVIVRAVEPGQTVTTADAVLVLSNRLVVSAQFDETDVGRVKIGQEAFITLDAYPDLKIEGTVDHIAYESEIVNNVTIYNVDILPKNMPEIFRSGMSVTVEIIEKKRTGVITIPSIAIHYDKERRFVLVKDKRGKTIERDIAVGLNDDKDAEIISGLTIEDSVVIQDAKYLPKRKSSGTNPFMPSRKR
ncbi:MAG: efflux RND transporter periplasmic adaptor subunit [Candidatus Omnitrophica bacterium]|nr:efflux RND transporter periplasmic adaptor subunit [Candidatus Omnitrophota bacterium]